MSSFKRKSGPAQKLPTGTRSSPSSSLTLLTSTGIPSLDDILGGGLPLSCSLVVLAPDIHSAYGQLVSKYFIAQGLACGQRVCIIDDDAKDLVERSMWIPTTAPQDPLGGEDEDANSRGEKIKIAWRYEQMKQFQTTVSSVPSYVAISTYRLNFFDSHS
jgi:elongator complex protein 4